MKLLLENWREYLAESEKADSYGHLYLFEDDNVTKTSFYDALNLLSENEGAVETFLENWERSVDYHIERLNEDAMSDMAGDPVLYLSTQAWMVLDKLKSKGAKKVINVAKKLNQFGKENPKTAKIAKVAIKGLLAAAAGYIVSQGVGVEIQDLASALQGIDMSIAKDVADVAQNLTPDIAADFISNQEEIVSQVSDTLSGMPGMEEVEQLSDQVSQDLESVSDQAAGGIENIQQQIVSGLEKIAAAVNDNIGLDIRMGSKFLAGSETEMTNKSLTPEQLDFLTDVVREVTEDGTKDQAGLHYGHWDAAADTQTTSDFYTTATGVDVQVCYDAMAANEPMPGFCLGQVNDANILSSDLAIQFKRTLGKATVTQVGDGVYEVTDFYDFEGTKAPLFKEIAAAVKDLFDINNDQKAYTIIHRIFQMRSKTGYEGFPVKLIVDLSSQGGGTA